MAWNRPTEDCRALSTKPPLRRGHRPRTTVRGAIAGVVVVLGVAIAAWLFLIDSGGRGATHSTVQNKQQIKEVKPQPAPSAKGTHRAVAEIVVGSNTVTSIEKPNADKAGVFLQPMMRRRVVHIERPPEVLFTNVFENFVAAVVSAEPGVRFLELDLSHDFDESFIASLKDKIEILPDDSKEVAAIKQAVIEAKEKVAEEVRNGRLPREVVLEARDEMNKIADFRDDLQNKVNEYMCEEDDPVKVLEYMKEANEVLKEYSTIPLEGPDTEEDALEQMQIQRDLKEQREKEAEILRARELEKKMKKEQEL